MQKKYNAPPAQGQGARAGTLASPHPAIAYSVRAELVEACSYGGQAKGFALWKPKRRLYRRQAAEGFSAASPHSCGS
jgi:hypothetical protein